MKNPAYSAVSVNEVNELTTKVYPNPTAGETTLEFAKELVGSRYVVFNQLGKEVASGVALSGQMTHDFSDLASGLYIIRSTNGKYTTNQRLSISK